jgi:lipopolysaccharide assembly protein A
MIVFLILAVLIAILAVIFAVQNVAVVSISFFSLNTHVSLAIALLAALAAGVLITLLLSIPGKVKGSWSNVSHKKKLTGLETEREQLKQRIDELGADRDKYLKKLEASEQEVAELEEQLASVTAALQDAEKRSGSLADGALVFPEKADGGGEE